MTFLTILKQAFARTIAPLLLFVALPALPAFAQAEMGTDTEQAANPALWKLSDADSEIWLFGTVHVLNPSLRWRTAKIDAAFEAADTFYVEAPIDDMDPAKMQPLIMKYGVNTTGTPLVDLIGEEATANTLTAFKMLGMPPEALPQFAALRPWLVGVTLQALQIQARGGDPESGVEKLLWAEAKAAGKTLGAFETIEQQLRIFGDLPMEEEVLFYQEGIRQFVEQPNLLDSIIADWRVGDTDGLGDKIAASMGADQDVLYAKLITERNKDWALQIKALMAGSGKIFIAVGAGHLAGEGSVQDHLAALGLEAVRQ
ncbi:MAG: TraB/GumN family protein [Alphaproteobacteria bacterium]|nr:MAG: TraB/GumN family protein [Alphaproteobacteria bacterium]